MEVLDVLVVGGGPAGSTCARVLTQGGARVAVVDRATFPRVKLCSGWLSAPIWDVLEMSPREYPGGLWEWHRCHVRYRGEDHAIRCRGWFVRRFELDDFLLRRSGAELRLGVSVADIARDGDGMWSVAGLRARHLVGAGGTHCPVARRQAPPRPLGPVGVQEHEFRADPLAIARTRLGRDGEPELLLHDDLSGYSWNVPKSDWLNVGTGTADPKEVRTAWQSARASFQAAGHLPATCAAELDAMKGYSYYLFHPEHLRAAADVDDDGKGGVYLIGDSLGLAQPLTAEGILPAVVSGRVLAEAILAGAPASYPERLASHPVLADYRRVYRAREIASTWRRGRPRPATVAPTPAGDGLLVRKLRHGLSAGFAWMFSGARLRPPRVIDAALEEAEWWLQRRAPGVPAGTSGLRQSAKRWFSAFDDRRAAHDMRDLLERAGVTVGGDEPWDIQVHDERVYARALREGTLGVGEAYVDGWWDCQAIDQMFDRLTRARLDLVLRESWILMANAVRARLSNLQATRAFEVGVRHYDVGNDLYRAMLGPRMVYTCGYWRNADDLDAAQEAKLDLVCRKIGARPGMRILDLGCGWAGFAAFAAQHYGAHVVGYTVSREQCRWAREHYAGLPVEIRLEDYRKATGHYDAVVSIGLMEHVGPKNHRAYMELATRCLAPGGTIFIHTIGGQAPRTQIDPWYDKYIFPNAVIPTLGQLTTAMHDLLVVEDVHNIGPDYDRTLMAWWRRFDEAWPSLRAKYGDRFYRMWKFYLLTSAAQFRARALNLFQIVATVTGTAQPPTARAA